MCGVNGGVGGGSGVTTGVGFYWRSVVGGLFRRGVEIEFARLFYVVRFTEVFGRGVFVKGW